MRSKFSAGGTLGPAEPGEVEANRGASAGGTIQVSDANNLPNIFVMVVLCFCVNPKMKYLKSC